MIMSYYCIHEFGLCVKIDELNSLVVIYVNEFMIISYVYELWLCVMIYELWFMFMGRSAWVMFVSYHYQLWYMSLDYEFTITVGVCDLWINTAAIRKHVSFNCVRKAGRRSYPLTRAADLGPDMDRFLEI